jgi:hypothetical protein
VYRRRVSDPCFAHALLTDLPPTPVVAVAEEDAAPKIGPFVARFPAFFDHIAPLLDASPGLFFGGAEPNYGASSTSATAPSPHARSHTKLARIGKGAPAFTTPPRHARSCTCRRASTD